MYLNLKRSMTKIDATRQMELREIGLLQKAVIHLFRRFLKRFLFCINKNSQLKEDSLSNSTLLS